MSRWNNKNLLQQDYGREKMSCLFASAHTGNAVFLNILRGQGLGVRRFVFGNVLTEKAVVLVFYHLVTLTGGGFQTGPIEYGDGAAHVFDKAAFLQVPGGYRNPFAANAEHIGYQVVGHDQIVGLQEV